MGAGDWVAGGVRRAVSGVTGLLPGQSAAAQGDGKAEEGHPQGEQAQAAEVAEEPVIPQEPAVESSKPTTRSTGRRPARPRPAAGTPAAEAPSGAVPAADAPPADASASPWSAEELAGFHAALDAEIARLREELDMGEADLADLVADSGDGSGDDQADAGSKTFEREHEMSVNANTREMLDQALRAVARLDAGTYGICERCGRPIGAARLRAFPRATLCIGCKQAEERR